MTRTRFSVREAEHLGVAGRKVPVDLNLRKDVGLQRQRQQQGGRDHDYRAPGIPTFVVTSAWR